MTCAPFIAFFAMSGRVTYLRIHSTSAFDCGCLMYDSLYSCQLKSAQGFPRWSGRCQGRRTLAFILTLDSDPATVIIEPGSNLERSFRDSNHSWKPFFHC